MGKIHLEKLSKECVRDVTLKLSETLTIGEAVEQLREKEVPDESHYVYVIDDEERLVGVVSMRDLLFSKSDMPLSSIIERKVITLREEASLHKALKIMEKHRLLALPVLDSKKHLKGVIDVQQYFDDPMSARSSKERMQIFQTLGLVLEEGKRPSVWHSYKTRMPWILCNMAGGFACAIISHLYEVVIAKVIILAMFIPLVLSLSESISMQSMTQSMHEIGRHFSFWRQSVRYVIAEARLFILLAVTSGLVVGAISLFWEDGWGPALTIASAIMISIATTALVGALIPLILHAWRWDPKVAAGPIVLMFADVFTTMIYLSLATWWLL